MYSTREMKRSRQAKYIGRVSRYEDVLAVALMTLGIKFARQQRIMLTKVYSCRAGVPPHYMVDFLLPKNIVVEVDSYTHRIERKEWDNIRDSILIKMGYHVIRFKNEEIRKDLTGCVKRIMQVVSSFE